MRSHFRTALCATVAVVSVSSASPAAAQTDCSAGDLRPLAEGWLPTSIGLTLAEKKCEATQFVKRVFSTEDDPDDITPAHVLEASRPQLDPAQQRARDEFLAAEKIKLREQREYAQYLRSNPANEAVSAALQREEVIRNAGIEITEPFQKWPDGYDIYAPSEPGGLPTLVQRGNRQSEPPNYTGEGVRIGPNGIEAGTFKNGELDGVGEEIESDGTYREGNFRDGLMEGPGLQVGRGDGGQFIMTTGNFDDDFPDGQVTLTYPDGSRRRQQWDDGQLVSQGPMAGPGATLANAPAPAVGPAAGVYQSALEWEMVPQKDGGTLDGTFESNGQPTGEMIRRYADGTAQRELWEGGKIVGRGALSRPGGVPPRIGKVFRPQLPPRETWRQPIARPAPTPAPTSSGSGWGSVCSRNYAKLRDLVYQRGGLDGRGVRLTDTTYMRVLASCREYDPKAERDYQEFIELQRMFPENANAVQNIPSDAWFFEAANSALSDPNWSAELGPIRGQAGGSVVPATGGGGGGQPGGGGEEGPAPGTSVGPFNIANPTLPQSFQANYSGTGLSPDTINQQMDADPELQRIQAELDSTRDVVRRLRLLIAQLEGRIVIMRQSQDFPDARRLIEGMTESRNAAIANCRNIAADQSSCTAPLR